MSHSHRQRAWMENTATNITLHDVLIVRRVANNLAVAICVLNLHRIILDYKNSMKSILFSYTNKHPNVIIYFKGFQKIIR